MDFDKVVQRFRALHEHEVEYVLVGGVAINLHGLVRSTDDDDPIVDLFSRLGDAVRYEDLEFESRDFEGVPVRIATPKTLFRTKRDTVRPDDRRDAQRLAERFGLEDA